MTIVGVVSDTHFPRFGTALPRALDEGLRAAAVTRILHLGDMTDALAVPLFEAIAPFDAVAGNNDGGVLRERFGRRKIVRIEEVRVGMIHGDDPRVPAVARARTAFDEGEVDVVLFGHSHRPLTERRGATLFANPGSPTDKRFNPRFSYAVLRVDGARADVELRYYASRAT